MPGWRHAVPETCVDYASSSLTDSGNTDNVAHGISIPMSYTAHLAPLSSAKLHADVIAAAKDPSAAETPYVVMMSQVNVLSAEPPAGSSRCGDRVQQCWIFEHPRSDLILDAAGECFFHPAGL